ncbi:MAG TPA: T9SS type A sorting domain-containing protein, partial [Puia sp.]|nr:T9SS type A sorting domain-containing protein [Puia sp.]
YNSGTVDATTNASTVVFGGNNLNITSAGMSFNHVIVTANTSTLTNSLTVNGNLIINGTGVLAAGANMINLSGNWTNRATAGFTEATSTVNFVGSTLQTITTPGGENFANLNVNNSGPGIQLSNNTTVSTTLTMTQGNIDLNGNTMTLGLSVANRGTLVRTLGTMINAGTFTRWFNTTTIPNNSATGLFPTGTPTDYRPFYVSAPVTGPTTGGTISVSYTNAISNSVVSIPDPPFTVVIRKDLNWAVGTANGFAGGNFNLNAQGTGYGQIGNVSDLRLTLANSVVGTAGVNGGTTSNPQVNRTGLTNANLTNTFYIGSINAASSTLPITLISFTAIPEKTDVRLDWETAAETNNDHFTIQRSDDATTWADVTNVSAVGNSSTDSYYTAYDQSPLPGTSFYRLKQTDMDGKFTFSAVRKIEFTENASLQIYPNPASDYIVISGVNTNMIQVSLFNSSGQRIVVPTAMNGNKVTLYVSSIRSGVYFVQIIEGDNVNTRVINVLR